MPNGMRLLSPARDVLPSSASMDKADAVNNAPKPAPKQNADSIRPRSLLVSVTGQSTTGSDSLRSTCSNGSGVKPEGAQLVNRRRAQADGFDHRPKTYTEIVGSSPDGCVAIQCNRPLACGRAVLRRRTHAPKCGHSMSVDRQPSIAKCESAPIPPRFDDELHITIFGPTTQPPKWRSPQT